MSRIDRVEIHAFAYEVPNLGLPAHGAAGVGNWVHRQGSNVKASRYAVRILTDDGLEGEYVTHWVGTPAALAQSLMLAPHLLGRDPETREQIYDDLKRELRAYDHMGHGPLDIALWDLAGKKYGASVATLLGGFRTRLPTYASTYHGQDEPGGLDSPAAFADFAAACKALGYTGFKIHGWHDGDRLREARNLLGVRERVGDDMALMIDPACELRTFMDALYVGRACDEAGYFWYEDPYRDAAVSAFGHKRLREKLKTPLLVTEHVRGLEQKGSFVVMGGCDMIHADPEYDMGITGCHEDRPPLRSARPRRPAARLGPGAPPLHRRDPQHPLLRIGAGRPRHAERRAPGLRLRLQRPAGRRRRGRLLPGPRRPRPRRHL